jgi:acetyl esterase
MPLPLVSVLAGKPIVVDGVRLETRSQLLIRLLAASGYPQVVVDSVDLSRRLFTRDPGPLGPPWRRLAKVADARMYGPNGALPVRIYQPSPNARSDSPALVYFHGGGWVIGSVETHDRLCRFLAHEVPCTVVSVDYRLAPEHRFPAAVDDAQFAYRWVLEQSRSLGIRPDRVAVAGDSAGGNLAAVVCRQAATSGEPQPCFQLLIYPATDLAFRSRSHEVYAEGFFLTHSAMRWFRDHYLPGEAAIDDPRASPLRAATVRGLAPAFIMTAGFDPLRDEGRAYAEKLVAEGVPVRYRCYEPLIHGFASMCGATPMALAAVREGIDALRSAFARHPNAPRPDQLSAGPEASGAPSTGSRTAAPSGAETS